MFHYFSNQVDGLTKHNNFFELATIFEKFAKKSGIPQMMKLYTTIREISNDSNSWVESRTICPQFEFL